MQSEQTFIYYALNTPESSSGHVLTLNKKQKQMKTTALYTVLFILALLISLDTSAQVPVHYEYPKARLLKQYAADAEKCGDIYSAIAFLEKYIAEKKKDADVCYKLAHLHYQSRNYIKAQEYFWYAYEQDKQKYNSALYYFALMLKMNGEYKMASYFFERFKKEYAGKDAKKYNKLIRKEQQGILWAQSNRPDKEVSVAHLGSNINNPHIDFAPVMLNSNTLMYSSLRMEEMLYCDEQNKNAANRRFYVSHKTATGWSEGQLMNEAFNDQDFNSGNAALSADGLRLYFTRFVQNWKGQTIGEIYRSDYFMGEWTRPLKLCPAVNDGFYTATQPTVATDPETGAEVLYFVSNRPGGRGSNDIWYAVFDNRRKRFKQARNAGRINTAYDECTPFYDNHTATLYFSSDGHPGLGGLDVFSANGMYKQWTGITNLNEPVNSPVDDLYYTIDSENNKGFFVSNRQGGLALIHETCCDDIYEFKVQEKNERQVEISILASKDADVFSSENNLDPKSFQNIENISLRLIQYDNEGSIAQIQESIAISNGLAQINMQDGFKYRLEASAPGYFSKVKTFTFDKNLADVYFKDVMVLTPINNEPIVLQNINYKFDSFELTESAQKILDKTLFKLLQENPNVFIELASHTDNVGSKNYNLNLSQKRAQSVVDYLVGKGIDKNRLIARGYGEQKPIADNNTDSGRAQNRRTEFKVIENFAVAYSMQ